MERNNSACTQNEKMHAFTGLVKIVGRGHWVCVRVCVRCDGVSVGCDGMSVGCDGMSVGVME